MTRPLALLPLALLALLPASVRCQPERCFSRQHQNATVNARAALASLGVATAARSLATEQDCVLACCSQQVQPGARCNMAVFNGNKRSGGGEDNCFLYHCPNERDCPLMKAPPGVRTYDIFKGAVHLSTIRPVAATTVTGRPAATPPAATAPVLVTVTTTPAAKREDKTAKKTNKSKSHKKTKIEEAGPRTADKLAVSTPPPPTTRPTTTATAVVTPPPVTMTPPTTTMTPLPVTVTPPTTMLSPPPETTTLPTTTTPPPPVTTTPPTTTTTPPPVTTTPPTTTRTPPPSTATTPAPTVIRPTPSASPPPAATSRRSSPVSTPPRMRSSSRRSQMSTVLLGPPHGDGAQNGSAKVSSAGALKSGALALVLALVLAALTLALALGGRKAMESFDRRHYTRLELNDLHYDL